MENNKILILPMFTVLVFVLSFPIHDAHAATFTAVQSGNWNDPATWGGATPPVTINSGDTVTIPAGITVTNPIVIFNSGLIIDAGTIANSGTIANFGKIIIDVGGIISNANAVSNTGTIRNLGTITNDHDSTIVNSGTITNEIAAIASQILNSGLITSEGTITNFGSISNDGTIANKPNGIINNNEVLDNSGTITNDAGDTTNISAAIKNLGIITNHNTGTIANSGTIINSVATSRILNSGRITTSESDASIINNNGAKIENGFDGTITYTGSTTLSPPGTFTNAGDITNFGTITVTQFGTITSSGTITNTGDITLMHSSNIANSGTIHNNSGIIDLKSPGTITNENSGTIDNNDGGEITSDDTISNFGTINNHRQSTITNGIFGNISNSGTIFNECFGIFNNLGVFTGNPAIDPCKTAHYPITNGNWNDPTIWKQGTVPGPSDDVVIPTGFEVIIPNGVSVSNSRTITLDQGGILENDGSLINSGTIADSGEFLNYGLITNSGTTTITDLGKILNLFRGSMTGTITNSGTVNNDGIIDTSGRMNNSLGGTITNTGEFIISLPDTFTNSGTINNALSANSLVGGIINIKGDLINSGTITNSAKITNLGTITDDHGTITNNPGATFSNDGMLINDSGDHIDNTGTINNNSDGTIVNNVGDTITNNLGGTMNNIGSIDTTGGTFSNSGIVNSFAGSTITGIITGNQPNLINDHAPVANTATFSTTKNNPVLINLSAIDSDNNVLTYSIISQTGPFSGTLSALSANQVTYTPNTDFAGQDSFQFKVNDGTVDSNIATVTIIVYASAPTPTSTTTSSSQNPSTLGQPVTFTATVSPSSATGDVTITIDGISQPPVKLSAGQASLAPISILTAGAHTITSSYDGDSTFDISTSPTLTQTVNSGSLQATGAIISTTEGMSFSGMVAHFTDSDPNAVAGDFTSTINWGDGSTTSGVVSTNSNGGFDVSGTHTFPEEGSNPLSVMINDVDGATATPSGMANVADAPLTANPTNINGIAGNAFSGRVAHFTDADPNGIAGDYTGTIDWGDGTTTPEVISANGDGFDVSGTHTYLAGGSDTISIVINDAGVTAKTSGTATVTSQNPTQQTLSANKDSFVQKLAANSNEGINPNLRVMDGVNRVLVSFNQDDISSAAAGKTLQNAKLKLFVTANGNNWGPQGRTIEAHKILSDWAEGNGWNLGNKIRGTGSGVTWNCATDTNIANFKPDCTAQWNGGNFDPVATSSVTITKTTSGWLEFDVTSDVNAFLSGATTNHGWIIKKTDETSQGLVKFDSREVASNQPQLVLTFGP